MHMKAHSISKFAIGLLSILGDIRKCVLIRPILARTIRHSLLSQGHHHLPVLYGSHQDFIHRLCNVQLLACSISPPQKARGPRRFLSQHSKHHTRCHGTTIQAVPEFSEAALSQRKYLHRCRAWLPVGLHHKLINVVGHDEQIAQLSGIRQRNWCESDDPATQLIDDYFGTPLRTRPFD